MAAINKPFLIEKTIVRSDGAGSSEGAHTVGVEILRVYYYSIGQYHECATLLTQTEQDWAKIGGSNIQRDLLKLTLQAAIDRSNSIVKKYA